MSITERERAGLFRKLEATLGPHEAETLMNMLPDRPANELVTTATLQSEMAAFRGEIHADFADFRSEIHRDFAEFRTEIREEFADFRTEIRTELRADIADVKGDVLRVENSLSLRIADLHTSMNRWAVGLTAANVVGMVTAIVT